MSFFVLGLIPGTNVQITFQVWLDCLLLAIEAVGWAWLLQRRCLEELRVLTPSMLTGASSLCYATGRQWLATGKLQGKAWLLHQRDSWHAL